MLRFTQSAITVKEVPRFQLSPSFVTLLPKSVTQLTIVRNREKAYLATVNIWNEDLLIHFDFLWGHNRHTSSIEHHESVRCAGVVRYGGRWFEAEAESLVVSERCAECVCWYLILWLMKIYNVLELQELRSFTFTLKLHVWGLLPLIWLLIWIVKQKKLESMFGVVRDNKTLYPEST